MNETKKSTALQAVKAVSVLVVICLVCVALLALCNDVFYISDEERARRAELKINKSLVEVYPDFVQDTSFNGKLDAAFATNPAYGSVSKVVRSTDGTYIIAASDSGVGYGKTPITVLVAITSKAKIAAWKISDGGAETQLDNLKGVNWYIGEDISSAFAPQKVAGTTKSSDALYNAIQMACFYAMNALHLGSNPEADAKAAVSAILEGNGLAGVELTAVANILNATVLGDATIADYLSDGDDRISYVFGGESNGVDIKAYVYGTDDNRKIVVVAGNAVFSSDNISAADAVYNKAANFRYVGIEFATKTLYAAIVETSLISGKTVYTVVGFSTKGYDPGNYTLQVTVVENNGVGVVEAIDILESGYATYTPHPEAEANILGTTGLIGATSATVDSLYSANKVSGVTQSANIITVAVKAVLAQFDAGIAE